MVTKLSDKNNSITVVPTPQSPAKAGFLQPYAGATTPPGWMMCDGSVLEQADYEDLYNNIGNTWDAFNHPVDGTPTVGAGQFAIPNLQGLYMPMAGDGGGDARSLATYQDDDIAAHNHEQVGLISSGSSVGQFPLANSPGGNNQSLADTQNTGGNETRPKTAPVSYVIKLYDDSASVSVSDVTATDVVEGNIALNSTFEAGDEVYGLVKMNKVQRKNLVADVISTGYIDENDDPNFLFNVTPGKWYRFQLSGRGLVEQTTGREITVYLTNGTDRISYCAEEIIGSNSGGQSQYVFGQVVHKAVDSRFRVEVANLGLGLDAESGGVIFTWIQIEELNNYIGTSEFT